MYHKALLRFVCHSSFLETFKFGKVGIFVKLLLLMKVNRKLLPAESILNTNLISCDLINVINDIFSNISNTQMQILATFV